MKIRNCIAAVLFLAFVAPMGCGGSSNDTGTAGTTGAAGSVGMTGTAGGTGTAGAAGTAGATGSGGSSAPAANAMMNFFVSSNTSTTANLGGLTGADARCQTLAAAVGHGSKTWRAYLSVANPATNARDRIGNGPYYNSDGMMLAADKDALHARSGDAALFIDEQRNKINGQWAGSPTPIQHDILTGSNAAGMLLTANTCGDWTATTGSSQVGHADGLGPSMNPAPPYNQWAGSHTGMCGDTAPGGGAGRIYCFVGN